MFFGSNKKVQKGPSAPKPILWVKKKGGGRADLKNAGVKKFSSFIWTLGKKKLEKETRTWKMEKRSLENES